VAPRPAEASELLGLWRVDQRFLSAEELGGGGDYSYDGPPAGTGSSYTMEVIVRRPPDRPRRGPAAPPGVESRPGMLVRIASSESGGGDSGMVVSEFEFRPAKSRVGLLPGSRRARAVWHFRGLVYRAAVERKFADRSVLKLRGKIYLPPSPSRKSNGLFGPWTGSGSRRKREQQVGTFVARRRMRFRDGQEEGGRDGGDTESQDERSDGDDEEDDDEDEKEENDDEQLPGGGGGRGEDPE
jgi:hypothetical protein